MDVALRKFTEQIFRSIYKVLLVLTGIFLVYQYALDILRFLVAGLYMVGHAVGIW